MNQHVCVPLTAFARLAELDRVLGLETRQEFSGDQRKVYAV
jgi:hypothetical protein